MSGREDKRSGAGRPPLIEPGLALHIGAYAESQRENLNSKLTHDRMEERHALLGQLRSRTDEIAAKLGDGKLTQAEARSQRRAAAAAIFGNRKVFGRSPRLIKANPSKYLIYSPAERGAGGTLMDDVYRLCRDKFESDLKAIHGADFRLTDSLIRKCRREYRDLCTELDGETSDTDEA